MGAREPGLSAGEAAGILGVDAAWVTASIDGGELRATHHHGSHPSRPMPERHRISERDLQVFLMGHAHELDGSHADLPRFIMIMAVRNPERRKSPHRRQGPAGADPGLSSYRRWTGEERKRLRSLVETRTPHQAGGVLGRNVNSVRVQARLGLDHPRGPDFRAGAGGHLRRGHPLGHAPHQPENPPCGHSLRTPPRSAAGWLIPGAGPGGEEITCSVTPTSCRAAGWTWPASRASWPVSGTLATLKGAIRVPRASLRRDSVPRRLALDPAPKPCLKRLPATAPGIAVFPAAGGLSNTPRSQAQLMSVSLRGDCNRAQAPQGLEGCHAQLM